MNLLTNINIWHENKVCNSQKCVAFYHHKVTVSAVECRSDNVFISVYACPCDETDSTCLLRNPPLHK